MATRFYLPSSGAAEISPSFDGGWESTGSADRIALINKKFINSITTLTDMAISIPDTSTSDYLTRQYVSAALGRAYCFQGTFSMVVRCVEDSGVENATLAVVVKVISNDGGTSRGTLFSTFSTDTEFGIVADTKIVNAQTITNTISQPGDRIVIEVGFHTAAPSTAPHNVTERFGTSATSDFALTSGLTTDLNPWAEFSMDILVSESNNLRPRIFGPGLAR